VGTRVGAGLSTEPQTEQAFREAAGAARAGLGGSAADLALVFASPAHLDQIDAALALVGEMLEPRNAIGCCAQGVVGDGREVEEGAAVSVWAASCPQAGVESFHMSAFDDGDGPEIDGLPDVERSELMLLLSDPFTFPADTLLDVLAEAHPGLPVVGGLASGGGAPGDSVLFHGDEPIDEGAVGVALTGVDAIPCVSQGAAPIGPEMVVTAAEGNVVLELASRPALEKLGDVIAEVDPRERALAASGLLIGVVVDENRPEYGRGDFLVRGLLGADEESGAIAVGETLRVGQTVRLHVRDARSADLDLQQALELQAEALAGRPTAGALLFTCNGRGRQMFSEPNHDAAALALSLGSPPMAGFFCAGEIGPVGGRSFLHGFTATMALFRAAA
jgi:small ligand-binding sensory domain FIST